MQNLNHMENKAGFRGSAQYDYFALDSVLVGGALYLCPHYAAAFSSSTPPSPRSENKLDTYSDLKCHPRTPSSYTLISAASQAARVSACLPVRPYISVGSYFFLWLVWKLRGTRLAITRPKTAT